MMKRGRGGIRIPIDEEAVKHARQSLNLSYDDMAEIIGVTANTYYCYEMAKTLPEVSIAKRIMEALGLTIDDIAETQYSRVHLRRA